MLNGNRIASIKKRILSGIIDFVVLWLIGSFIGIFWGKSLKGTVEPDGAVIQFGWQLTGFNIIFLMSFWLILLPITEGISGYTIGKKIAGLKAMDSRGTKITLLKAFIRHFFDFIDFFLFIGIIVAYCNKRHQRIGDLVAKTIVVEAYLL